MKFTAKQKERAELSLRALSEKASAFYATTDPLNVYQIETENGALYYVRGCIGEYDDLTFEELDAMFSDWQEDVERADDEDWVRQIIEGGLYEQAVELMDDELREELHAEMSPCTDEEFLTAYIKAHREKYGEDFEI